MKTKLLLLYIWVSFFHHGQTYRFKIIDPVIVFDYKTHQIVAIEDSLYRIEINLATKKSVKKPLHLDSQVTFQDFKSNFIPLSSEGSPIYFVDRGCGWVLELRKDSIVRVDRSFHHQNQFGGAFFMHQGKPYIFGGYGLFTYKKFITKYEVELKQWYLESEGGNLKNEELNIFGCNASRFSVLIGKKTGANFSNDLWTYTFKSKQWQYLGQVEGIDSLPRENIIDNYNNLILSINCLYEFDFEKRRLNRYRLFPNNTVMKYFSFPSKIVGLLRHTLDKNKGMSILFLMDQEVFSSSYRMTSTEFHLTQKERNKRTNFWIFLMMVLLVCSLLFVGVIIKNKRKIRGEISPNVAELLELWLSKPNYLLELNELNDLVNYDNPSMDTLKKRRENLTRLFVVEISSMYQLPEHQIYEPLPHPLDKRMKLLKLSSKLVERIKKGN